MAPSISDYLQKMLRAVSLYPSSRDFLLTIIRICTGWLTQQTPLNEKLLKDLKNIVDLFIVKGFASLLTFE